MKTLEIDLMDFTDEYGKFIGTFNQVVGFRKLENFKKKLIEILKRHSKHGWAYRENYINNATDNLKIVLTRGKDEKERFVFTEEMLNTIINGIISYYEDKETEELRFLRTTNTNIWI